MRWRAQAAQSLGLSDEPLLAGVSSGASCPRYRIRRWPGCAARSRSDHTPNSPRTSTFQHSISWSTSEEFTGLATGGADAVLFTGVTSLIDGLGQLLREAKRIVRPGGAVAVADLLSATGRPLRSGPNVFCCLEQVMTGLRVRGWTAVEFGTRRTAADERPQRRRYRRSRGMATDHVSMVRTSSRWFWTGFYRGNDRSGRSPFRERRHMPRRRGRVSLRGPARRGFSTMTRAPVAQPVVPRLTMTCPKRPGGIAR